MAVIAPAATAAGETAAGSAAASTAGEAAAGSAAGSGSTSAVGSIASYVSGSNIGEALSPVSTIVGMIQSRKAREIQQEQFDATFEENKRRFGLEFALREWATRKNMAIDMARQLYNRQYNKAQLNLQTQQVGESLKSSAQSRLQQQTEFGWLKEDREKAKKVSNAYNRGILSGLFGR